MSRASGGLPPLELQDFEPGADGELTVDIGGSGQPAPEEQPGGGEPAGGGDLESIREQVRQNAIATQLLADPNIQAYLAALQSGKQVRIAPVEQEHPGAAGGQPREPEEIPDPEDWESLNNQQLFEVTSKKTARLVQGHRRGLRPRDQRGGQEGHARLRGLTRSCRTPAAGLCRRRRGDPAPL